MTKKITKIVSFSLLGLILGLIVIVGGYVIYISAHYYRIEDNLNLSISNNKNAIIQKNMEYKISSYNIGFGAYTHDFSFFMDSGEMLDGTKVTGKNSTAKNKETVIKNLNGVVDISKQLNSDFFLFQEVDILGTRSHNVNQLNMLKEIGDYATTFAENFHSAYLLYPFNDPHGANVAGLATFSKYKINNAIRKSYPIDESFPNKYFDLDRCFSMQYFNIENNQKQLVIINSHMSAYDEGGKIRAKQLELLNTILKAEEEKGNYVIVGGDFNHDIINSVNMFTTKQKKPEWVFQLTNSDLTNGYRFAAATDAATCRSTDMPYKQGVNYTVVLDGYIVSDNIEIINNTNLVNDNNVNFMFSDHNPATMTFKLK